MKKAFLFLSLILFFGCVDVKIKSQIPKKTYYDLDTRIMQNKHCDNFVNVGFGEISSIATMDSKSIIHKKSNGEISSDENNQWIDNPKSMLKSMLLKQGYAKCLIFENPSLKRINKILSINILFLGFINNAPSIELIYKISDDKFNLLDMGILKKTQAIGGIAELQKLSEASIDDLLEFLLKEKNEK